MDQRGYRCRTRHRIRQPDVERDLGTLAHRTDEKTERHEAGQTQAQHEFTLHQMGIRGNAPKDLAKIQRAESGGQGKQTDEKSGVTDTVDDEGLAPA